MIEVIVVGEGQTEESFVRDGLASVLADREIFIQHFPGRECAHFADWLGRIEALPPL